MLRIATAPVIHRPPAGDRHYRAFGLSERCNGRNEFSGRRAPQRDARERGDKMFRRANREDETEREPERARRYQMKERWFDIGDDYTIVDEHGREAFRVDGKI